MNVGLMVGEMWQEAMAGPDHKIVLLTDDTVPQELLDGQSNADYVETETRSERSMLISP